MKVTGILLAGGKSSRFGRDKALLELGDVTLAERALLVIEPLCSRILISTNNPELARLGYETVCDRYGGIGPLAGLHAAIECSRCEHYIVIPCDTPCLTPEVYERILTAKRNRLMDPPAEGPRAVVAGTADGLVEPLIGYYAGSILHMLEDQIRRGDYMIQNLLVRIDAETEVFSDKRLFRNINTGKDVIGIFPDTVSSMDGGIQRSVHAAFQI